MLTLFNNKLRVINATLKEPAIIKLSSNVDLPEVVRDDHFFISKKPSAILPNGFAGYLLVHEEIELDLYKNLSNVIHLGDEFSYLVSGDVVRFNPDNESIRIIYRLNSPNNSFLITERCNSYCLMCSQPPRDIDDEYRVNDILNTIPLIDPSTREIILSGGEPTIIGDRLVDMIRKFRNYLPNTGLHILTNGRNFSNHDYTSKFEDINHHDCMFGIPLYSDQPDIHDYIVQAKNAFDETIKGILNLKRHGQRVEIRIVIHNENYKRLKELSEFIARNLTFVDQVVFMGLEPTGFAKVNMKALWIDPHDYQNELSSSINVLDKSQIVTKIYNIQLCLLDEAIQHKSVRSISDWKTEYDEECNDCARMATCCGIFGTGTGKHSEYIQAFSS